MIGQNRGDSSDLPAIGFRTPGGSRWRVYSTKNLEPSWLGQWTVRVEDADGRELHRAGFSYVSTADAMAPEKTSAAAQVLSPDSEQPVTPTQQAPASAP